MPKLPEFPDTLPEFPNRGLSTTGGQAYTITTVIFLFLVAIALALRVWAKVKVGRRFVFHDYAIFLSAAFALGYAILSILCFNPGVIAMHITDAAKYGPDAFNLTMKLSYATGFFWVPSTTFCKLSLLHLYIGIFQRKVFLWSAYIIAGCTVIFCLLYEFLHAFRCDPVELEWTSVVYALYKIPPPHTGTCMSFQDQTTAFGIVNLFLDFAIVILPIPVVWSLQMPRKRKLMLIGVFSLGLCICAVNVVRVWANATADQADFTYSNTNIGLFAGLETYTGIITACLPMLRPLISRRNSKGEYTGGSSYGPQSSRSKLGPTSAHVSGNASYSDNRYFERLHDDGVPLSEIVIKSDGDRAKTAYSAESVESTKALNAHSNAKRGITVTNEIGVSRR